MNKPLSALPAAAKPDARRRPRFQFTLTGLLVLMFAVGALAAPGYYLTRAPGELPQARLVGMLMMLAGPLLVMTVLSVFLALTRRRDEDQ